jgi:hypothetical protein
MTQRITATQFRMEARPVLLGLALLWAACSSAAADPRSDALAGAGRCQAIADDRTFLNCLYGAMQPLRAELGLPAAPPAQTSLVPPATLPMIPAPQQQASRAVPPPRNDGLVGGLLGGRTEVAPQRMAGFEVDRGGFFTVTLADGAVWKQLDGDTARAHWRGPPAELVVIIRSGAFGAHVLQVRGQATTYKVIRVR